ncbi:MAG TPA: TIGR03435 family protein, partial [Bryobacteraceae bacterium]|nr:TIGR03435 family protein [Bryobacteraceae bacterium]
MRWIGIAALLTFHAMGQEPVFEVASIKPASLDRPGYSIRNELGRMETRNTTLRQLIEYALGVRPFQVIGGPTWINDARFDITAKNEGSEETVTIATRQARIR